VIEVDPRGAAGQTAGIAGRPSIDRCRFSSYAEGMTTTLAARTELESTAADDACCGPAVASGVGLRPEEAAGYVPALKALADPHRLRMLSLIAGQSAGAPLCVCEIEGEFGLAQPTISHHLKVLREAGLVTVTKRGLWHYYAPRPEGLAAVRQLLDVLAAPAARA
jgi:ArsR family transcriptional regulator